MLRYWPRWKANPNSPNFSSLVWQALGPNTHARVTHRRDLLRGPEGAAVRRASDHQGIFTVATLSPTTTSECHDTNTRLFDDHLTDSKRRGDRNWSLLLIFGSMAIAVLASLLWFASALLSLVNAAEPIAFSIYCLDHIDECPNKGPRSVRYSVRLMQLVSRVQAQVNSEITPRRETVDVWSADVSSGDCDDYVMTKRRRLIRAGIPATAMRVAVSRRFGEGHVVLILKTDKGEIVLDNLRRTAYLR